MIWVSFFKLRGSAVYIVKTSNSEVYFLFIGAVPVNDKPGKIFLSYHTTENRNISRNVAGGNDPFLLRVKHCRSNSGATFCGLPGSFCPISVIVPNLK